MARMLIIDDDPDVPVMLTQLFEERRNDEVLIERRPDQGLHAAVSYWWPVAHPIGMRCRWLLNYESTVRRRWRCMVCSSRRTTIAMRHWQTR